MPCCPTTSGPTTPAPLGPGRLPHIRALWGLGLMSSHRRNYRACLCGSLPLRIHSQSASDLGRDTMLGALIAVFPLGPSTVLKDHVLAAATPSPTPSVVSSDNAAALPSWLLVSLLVVVGLVILAGFTLT